MKIYTKRENLIGQKITTAAGVKEVGEDQSIEIDDKIGMNMVAGSSNWVIDLDAPEIVETSEDEEDDTPESILTMEDEDIKELILNSFTHEELIDIAREGKMKAPKKLKEDEEKLKNFISKKLTANYYKQLLSVILTPGEEEEETE